MRIRENENQNFPYFTYKDVEFQVRFLEDDVVESIESASTEFSFDSKHQKEKKLNAMKYARKVAKKAIISWRGMKRKNLIDFVNPAKKIFLDDGESWNDDIEFNDDIKDFIIENMHHDFAKFIVFASREVEAFAAKTKKEELENLKVGSAGANDPIG